MKCRVLQDIKVGGQTVTAGATLDLEATTALDLALIGEVEVLEKWATVTSSEPVVARRIRWRAP